MIQLNKASFQYQNHLVLNALDIHFETGVSYLITGGNGVGKTTLLKLIAGQIYPSKGSVKYDFINDHSSWDEKYELRKKHIHFIPTHALHELISSPDLFYQQRYYSIESAPLPTVREYLGERVINASPHLLPPTFQLNYLLDLELTQLSNGQVKKLIILKKLLDSIPRYLLLDYPFEGLDVQSRMELRDFLDHLTTTFGVQLIIADHEHPELPKVLTKKCLLDTNEVLISDFTIIKSTARINHVTYVPIKNKTEPVVEMQELKIQYGDKVILENLNWKINRGERWALTGKNGSGKTTLFSFIFADHPMAYSEKIFLFGKRRGTGESIWDIKKRISYLGPEQAHFLNYTTEQLTVAEFLQKTTNTNELLNNLIDFFQIKQLLSKKVKYLSNGQLQLVFLINLFHLQKELLLLDEPFQFLDPQHKKRVSEYLEAHLNESVTLVLITHYDSDVGQWTNHRMIL